MSRTLRWLCGLTFVALQSVPTAQSPVISSSRRIDWSHAGVAGGIPNRTAICATLSPGATAADINSAIAACPAGQVVKLQPGTFTIGTPGIVFNNKSNVTLRGAGPSQTVLSFFAGNRCGGLGGDVCFINGDANSSDTGNERNVASWTAGYDVGTTTITLSGNTQGTTKPAVGTLLVLDQLDDGLVDTGEIWVCQTLNVCSQQGGVHQGRVNRSQTQVVRVTGISSGACPCTVTISPGLYMPNWRASQSPGAWWSNSLPIAGSGLEDLSMDHSNTTGVSAGTFVYNAYGIWFRNIRDINSNQKHIWLYQSSHVTVRDSYFYGTKNAASESYGIDTFTGGDHLVENNIFEHIATPMINEGGVGSVFGYNFSIDDYYAASPSWQQSSSYHHAAGNAFILWESNDGAGLTADDIHGSSHFITAFRNVWSGRDTPAKTRETIAIHIEAFNRYYNIVGNVLGTPGYHLHYEVAPYSLSDSGDATITNRSIYALGYSANEGTYWVGPPAIPNDVLTKTTLYRWGNYDSVNATTRFVPGEVPSVLTRYSQAVPPDHALPASLYLPAKPPWFAASTPWPAIGPDVTGGEDPTGHAFRIPAHVCYDSTPKTNGMLNFDAAVCYAGSLKAPTNLRVVP